MTRSFNVLALAAALVLGAAAPSWSATTFSLSVDSQPAMLGDTVQVSITLTTDGMSAEGGLTGYGVSVDFGAGNVAANPVGTPYTGTIAAGAPTPNAGVIGSFAGLGFSPVAAGSEVIGTFDLTVNAQTDLMIGFLINGVDSTTGDSDVTFQGITVPEPASGMALASLGTLGLLVRRRNS